MDEALEINNLLDQGYSAINELNSVSDMTAQKIVLQQNGQKMKAKACVLVKSLRDMVDALDVHLQKFISQLVKQKTDILESHSDEIIQCVDYISTLCVMAESVKENDNIEETLGTEFVAEFIKSLNVCTEFQRNDYDCFTSVDLEIDLREILQTHVAKLVSVNSSTLNKNILQCFNFGDLPSKDNKALSMSTITDGLGKLHLTQNKNAVTEMNTTSALKTVNSCDIKAEKTTLFSDKQELMSKCHKAKLSTITEDSNQEEKVLKVNAGSFAIDSAPKISEMYQIGGFSHGHADTSNSSPKQPSATLNPIGLESLLRASEPCEHNSVLKIYEKFVTNKDRLHMPSDHAQSSLYNAGDIVEIKEETNFQAKPLLMKDFSPISEQKARPEKLHHEHISPSYCAKGLNGESGKKSSRSKCQLPARVDKCVNETSHILNKEQIKIESEAATVTWSVDYVECNTSNTENLEKHQQDALNGQEPDIESQQGDICSNNINSSFTETVPIGFSLKNLMQDDCRKCVTDINAKHVRTISGNNGSSFNHPTGLAVRADGILVVADTGNNEVKVFRDNEMVFSIGNKDSVKFVRPSAVVCDNINNMYIKDDRCIQAFDKNGKLMKVIGLNYFSRPYGLSLANPRTNASLIVIDDLRMQPCIYKYDIKRGQLECFPFSPLMRHRTCSSKVRFLATWNDQVLVSDLGASMMYMSDLIGRELKVFGYYGYGEGEFREPSGVAADADGNWFIADSRNNRIQLFKNDGTFLTVLKLSQPIKRPSGIHLTSDGHLYVINYLESVIKVFKLCV